ncbi:MAG: M14 family zinc carboxypeptidase [Planctomycetota bacterium]
MQIDGDFPGGNILVDGLEGDQARLRQDLRDTDGSWFYWSFRVRDLSTHAGRPLRFQFTTGNVIGTRGPCVSLDAGRSWNWLGAAALRENGFEFTVPAGIAPSAELRFSQNWPYLQADFERFLATLPTSDHWRVDSLCQDRAGRVVERLRVGNLRAEKGPDAPLAAPACVLLTARHHCCESTPNFTLEGFVLAALEDTPAGRWFRENVEAWILPFMDKDGVEQGDQGKNRHPHDHNRDYAPTARLYPSVRALCEQVPVWANSRLRASIDLHCPVLRGEWNEHIYFVGTPDPGNWERIGEFSRILESVQAGPLPFQAAGNLAFGAAWNTFNDPALVTHSRWAQTVPGVKLAATVEIPYANVRDITVTPDAAAAFGRDLFHALRAWLPATL